MELKYEKIVSKEFIGMFTRFECFNNISSRAIFYFSIYKNGIPGSGKTEIREIIKTNELSHKVIHSLNEKIPPNFELAINSLIEIDNQIFHLPLIDFNCKVLDNCIENLLQSFNKEYKGKLYILSTGRSFHGYHDLLLSDKEWREYLGKLLLLNKRDYKEEIIDSRWVGHSLIQGFSALRISFNTNSYLSLPKFIKTI